MSDSIFVIDRRDPLMGLEREDFIHILKEKLAGRVTSAWIFGSFAAGRLKPSSDIDLILVVSTTTPFLERGKEFFDLLDIGPTIDILVYTPEEFQKLTENPTAGFWKSVCREMIQIV